MRAGRGLPINGLVTKKVLESPPVRIRLVVPTRKFRPNSRGGLAGGGVPCQITWLEVVTTIALLLMESSRELFGVFTTSMLLVVLAVKLFSGSLTVKTGFRK